MRAEWKYETAFERGRKRTAFLNKCVKKFRIYYYYPEDYTVEEGNSVVREHLKRNLKHNMFIWKRDANKQVEEALKKGEEANRLMFKPHYLEEDAWKGCCDYWDSTGHKQMSETNKENRKNLKFPHASGAKPFEERRIARELETGEVMSELDLFNIVYTKKHAELMEIKEAMERAAQEFASQTGADEPPPSPATCRKKNILISLRARKLNKGKIFMNPNKTIHDFLGPEEAAEWTTSSIPARIPNHAYDMMGRALNEVTDMVQAMDGINEITRSHLDEELKKLADGAYPNKDDPVQKVLWGQYIKVAASLASSQFERFKKVIIEDTEEDGTENGHDMEDYEGNADGQNIDDEAGDMDDDRANMDGHYSDEDGSFNNTQLSP
ncbi:hypothetical protein DCAR_0414477 [Daucus carota subsp. sativus]|uniref:Uncharacterized protein n=3 Tax=Daucus carota subsp. sativus TaxID=79200 RepID=A0A175YC32_DAUCS|nr:hypothetical protein DCAR_0414477 [Daucus carota subsp. sativus]